MNYKVFLRLTIVVIIAVVIVGGVVAGGVALSHHILSRRDMDYVEDQQDITDSNEKSGDKNTEKKEKVLNVLLLGVDAEGYRTDVIILAQYNYHTKKVNMLQIPRDTKVDTTRSDKKINSAYGFGKEEELFKEIHQLIGIEVDKYFLVNLKGFRALIDEIGGVEMNVPINMNYSDPIQGLYINLKKGEQVLDGKKAEMFVRFRKNNDGTGYPEGDIGRIKAQQEFINKVIDKVFSLKNIFKTPKLVSIILKNVKTNISVSEIPEYVGEALQVDRNDINMMLLPGESAYIDGVSYYIHNKTETEELIKQYFTPSATENDDSEESTADEDQGEEKQYKSGLLNKYIRIEIIDGCDNAETVAAIVEDLKRKNFNVVKTEKFNGVKYSKTKIIDRSNKNRAKEVAKAMSIDTITKDKDKSGDIDVTVIVGEDMVK